MVAQPSMAGEVAVEKKGAERRVRRRHDVQEKQITVDAMDGKRLAKPLGVLVDISTDGIKLRTDQKSLRVDQQIRVRLELPEHAGISPFIDTSGPSMQPKREWVGWMSVNRVLEVDEQTMEVAGRLVDMHQIDRGMLGLYLSTHPLA